jgi:hypothetical protein
MLHELSTLSIIDRANNLPVSYQLVRVDRMELKAPAYLQVNPLGKVIIPQLIIGKVDSPCKPCTARATATAVQSPAVNSKCKVSM